MIGALVFRHRADQPSKIPAFFTRTYKVVGLTNEQRAEKTRHFGAEFEFSREFKRWRDARGVRTAKIKTLKAQWLRFSSQMYAHHAQPVARSHRTVAKSSASDDGGDGPARPAAASHQFFASRPRFNAHIVSEVRSAV